MEFSPVKEIELRSESWQCSSLTATRVVWYWDNRDNSFNSFNSFTSRWFYLQIQHSFMWPPFLNIKEELFLPHKVINNCSINESFKIGVDWFCIFWECKLPYLIPTDYHLRYSFGLVCRIQKLPNVSVSNHVIWPRLSLGLSCWTSKMINSAHPVLTHLNSIFWWVCLGRPIFKVNGPLLSILLWIIALWRATRDLRPFFFFQFSLSKEQAVANTVL